MKKILGVILALGFFSANAHAQVLIKKASTTIQLEFMIIDSSDHIAGKTGTCASATVKISKNGATGVTPSGTVAEVDATNHPGLCKIAGNATDTNTDGAIWVHASGTGIDPTDVMVANVVEFDPYDASGSLIASTINRIRRATAQGGSATTITLDASASATDMAYARPPSQVCIISGTGSGVQSCKHIIFYVGSTKVATVDSVWIVNPDSTSVFEIEPY